MPRQSLPQVEHCRRFMASATKPRHKRRINGKDRRHSCMSDPCLPIERVCREQKRPNRPTGSRSCRCLHAQQREICTESRSRGCCLPTTCLRKRKFWSGAPLNQSREEQTSKDCQLHIHNVASRSHDNFTIKHVFLGSKSVRVGGASQDTHTSSVDQLRTERSCQPGWHTLNLSSVATTYCDKAGLFKSPMPAFIDFSLGWILCEVSPQRSPYRQDVCMHQRHTW